MTNFAKIANKIKETRESKGLLISEISKKIKIRKQYLEAIEENNIDIIPGKAYVEGYINIYSSFLDIEDEINKFKKEKPLFLKRKNYHNIKKHLNNNYFVFYLFSFIAILILFLVFLTDNKKSRRDEVMQYLFEDEYILKK